MVKTGLFEANITLYFKINEHKPYKSPIFGQKVAEIMAGNKTPEERRENQMVEKAAETQK